MTFQPSEAAICCTASRDYHLSIGTLQSLSAKAACGAAIAAISAVIRMIFSYPCPSSKFLCPIHVTLS
ncbi:hypothetical protein FZX15_04570 [Brucella suis bv. 1]|nr:hypothetical protein FZX15_04570 [Brucella suis bv. 1]